ncbi:hypothetical protein [Gemella cuniculi]|uniref:hypothetical protein n=1 Tax=Gemella cuniculi TaxID=150240 RepID=UPI000423859F|nr:hypothetical protein [Gemella cuniculi]
MDLINQLIKTIVKTKNVNLEFLSSEEYDVFIGIDFSLIRNLELKNKSFIRCTFNSDFNCENFIGCEYIDCSMFNGKNYYEFSNEIDEYIFCDYIEDYVLPDVNKSTNIIEIKEKLFIELKDKLKDKLKDTLEGESEDYIFYSKNYEKIIGKWKGWFSRPREADRQIYIFVIRVSDNVFQILIFDFKNYKKLIERKKIESNNKYWFYFIKYMKDNMIYETRNREKIKIITRKI